MSGPKGRGQSGTASVEGAQARLDLAKRGMNYIRVTRWLSLSRTKSFSGTSAFNAKTKKSPANQDKLVTIVTSRPWPWQGLNH